MTDQVSTAVCDPARLAALRHSGLLDRPAKPAFDRLTRLAARVLRAPTALISLVDRERQFFASCVGLAEPWATTREAPLSHSFCQHVVATAEPLIVGDARTHPLLHDNPAIADMGVVAYAGLPLITSEGYALGSFCVADTVPRVWTSDEIDTLRDLAAMAISEIELPLAEEALRTSEAKLRLIIGQLPTMVWTTDAALHVTSALGAGFSRLGRNPQRYLGGMVADMIGTDDPDAPPIAAHRRALQGSAAQYEWHTEDRVFDVRVEPLRDTQDRITGCLGLALNITERNWLFAQIQAGHERLQALSAQLLKAQETERRMIARELHDEIGQALTAVQLNLQVMLSLTNLAELPARLEDSMALIEPVLQQVRELSLDLRPSLLDDLGLGPALRWYVKRQAERAGFRAQIIIETAARRPSADIETTCFRIVQEAVTNIVRYARATAVRVEVQQCNGQLRLLIRDDGIGFDVAAARKRAANGGSLGLLGMQERAMLVGGDFTIQSQLGRGTTVSARIPLRAPNALDELDQRDAVR
jgi:signal transduction histidine kinase